MMTLANKYFRKIAEDAQLELVDIAENPGSRRDDAKSRSMMLGILAASIVYADKAMCHRGMVTRASDAF